MDIVFARGSAVFQSCSASVRGRENFRVGARACRSADSGAVDMPLLDCIVFANTKGGCGKTTLGFQIASAYAQSTPDIKVLVLDATLIGDTSIMFMGGSQAVARASAQSDTRTYELRVNPQDDVPSVTAHLKQRKLVIADVSVSMTDVIDDVSRTIRAVAAALRPTDELCVVTFSNESRNVTGGFVPAREFKMDSLAVEVRARPTAQPRAPREQH